MRPERRFAAELIGSAALAAIVIGSGVMAERLAGGNGALALLGNTLATAAGLYVLIVLFAPLSGAHFNPAVSLAAWARGDLSRRDLAACVLAQLAGMGLGVLLAHAMFALPLWQLATKPRPGFAQALSEGAATFMLLLTVSGTHGHRREAAAAAVALTVAAGYWFTASTSFANPAITLARALSDTYAGVRFADVPGLLAGQLAGLLAGLLVSRALFEDPVVEATQPTQRGRYDVPPS